MRKTALSLSLLFALLAGCMVGCNDVKSKKVDGKEVLFTVGDTNIFADDILGFEDQKATYDFLGTDEGVKAVYEAVYKALAQKNVEITSSIEAAVKEKMDDWDTAVATYASENGVTTRNAEKTKLDELGMADRNELEQSYYLEEQKDELASKFKSDHTEPKTDSANGSTLLEKYVKNTSPMIVKHILAKVADNKGLTSKATTTSAEVDKISIVMQRLALGKASRNKFKNIALEESEDGSATNGGHLGIMDTYTSFVKEFKLGLYVSEMIQNHTNADYDKEDTLGMKDYAADLFTGTNAIYPGYEAGVKTIDVASIASVLAYTYEDEAKDEQIAAGNTDKADYDAELYPRNVIFNKYFNYPGIQYMKINTSNPVTVRTNIENVLKEVYPSDTAIKIAAKADAVIASNFYQQLSVTSNQNTNASGYVVDENSNPVVVAKSEFGIHFLSITWSSLDTAAATGTNAPDSVKYFMYGTNASGLTNTYVTTSSYNFGYSTETVAKNTRKTEIETRITTYAKGGFESLSASDELYDYEIFNYYLGTSGVTIPNASLEKAVKDYIEMQTSYKLAKIDEAQSNSWADYIESIRANQEMHDLLY